MATIILVALIIGGFGAVLYSLDQGVKVLKKDYEDNYTNLVEIALNKKIQELTSSCSDLIETKEQISALLDRRELRIEALVSKVERSAYASILCEAENAVLVATARLREVDGIIDRKQGEINDHLAKGLDSIAERGYTSINSLKKQREFCVAELERAEKNLQRTLHPEAD